MSMKLHRHTDLLNLGDGGGNTDEQQFENEFDLLNDDIKSSRQQL